VVLALYDEQAEILIADGWQGLVNVAELAVVGTWK